MAFLKSDLRGVNQVGRGSGLWVYHGPNSDDPTSANYFGAAASSLQIGDRIFVTLFTNYKTASQAYSSAQELVVTAVSTTVTVEEL